MDQIMKGSASTNQWLAAAPSSRPCCLIVEDQMLIALSIEAYLEDLGYDTAGPFRSCTEALDWLKVHEPQVAILDYSLVDGASTVLAHELLRRRIPFLVYSGHPRRADMPAAFSAVPWLEKPCAREDILAALRLALVEQPVEAPSPNAR
jgi:DNA-binding NtrC family response regulator